MLIFPIWWKFHPLPLFKILMNKFRYQLESGRGVYSLFGVSIFRVWALLEFRDDCPRRLRRLSASAVAGALWLPIPTSVQLLLAAPTRRHTSRTRKACSSFRGTESCMTAHFGCPISSILTHIPFPNADPWEGVWTPPITRVHSPLIMLCKGIFPHLFRPCWPLSSDPPFPLLFPTRGLPYSVPHPNHPSVNIAPPHCGPSGAARFPTQ